MLLRPPACLALLVVAAVACSPSTPAEPPVTPPSPIGTVASGEAERVEPEEVAERLLTQLRDEDYPAAYETLSTGNARDYATNPEVLRSNLTNAGLLVSEWSLDEPTHISVDETSKVEITGTVTYANDETGRVRIVLAALGLKADPWRVDEFELTRS